MGMTFSQFLEVVSDLPRRQLWRYGQAGDLPPGHEDVLRLAKANGNRPVLAYTHRRDFATIEEAGKLGFHVNLSADTIKEADELAETGLSVVVVLPSFYARQKDETLRSYRARLGGRLGLQTPAGRDIAICPATYYDTDCSRCQACSHARPGGTIIGFPAHGSGKRRVSERGVVHDDRERPQPAATG